jgi:hypothetical protein
MRQIYCRSYCRSFQPLIVENASLICGRCYSVLGRQSAQGLMYCENCGEYRKFFEGPLHAPPAEQGCGYVFGELVCIHCATILATVRELEQ